MNPEELQSALESPDAEERRRAVSLAAKHRTEDMGMVLVTALGDPDWRVRVEASRALSHGHSHPAVSRRLVDVLAHEDDVGYRNAAVEALGGRGEAAVSVLAGRFIELDADGRKLVAEALAKTASTKAIIPLGKLADDEDVNVRVAAIEAVAQVGLTAPERALPILDDALASSHQFVRLAALDAIRRLGLSLPWSILERLFATPALVISGLQLAAVVEEPRAARYYVKELELMSGRSWGSCLSAACRYAEHSEKNSAALSAALGHLSVEATAALEEATQGGGTEAGRALKVLCLKGGARAISCTTALLGRDEHAPLVADCVSLLGRDALEALAERLSDNDEAIRAHAVELLGLLAGDEALRPAILPMLRPNACDRSPLVVRAWLRVTTHWGEAEDLRVAMEQLGGTSDPATWRVVTPALEAGGLRYPEVAAQLARGVQASDRQAAGVAVLIGALSAPLMGSQEENLDWLVAALVNQSPPVRMAAVEVLGTLHEARAVDALGTALSDSEPAVRMSAVRALGRVAVAGVELARKRLLQLATDSANVGMVVAALQALGEGKDRSLVDQLVPLLEHPDVWRASAAVSALSGYSADVRLGALRRALAHPEADVVKSALELLEAGEETLDDLLRCLRHEAWEVRRAAADRIGSVGSARAGDALTERLADEGEPLVVAAIYRSLGKLATGQGLNWSMLPPDSGRDW